MKATNTWLISTTLKLFFLISSFFLSSCESKKNHNQVEALNNAILVSIKDYECGCEEFSEIFSLAEQYGKNIYFQLPPDISDITLKINKNYPNNIIDKPRTLRDTTMVYFYNDMAQVYFSVPWPYLQNHMKLFHRFVHGP